MKTTATAIAALALAASPLFAYAQEGAVAITGSANVTATTSVKVRTGTTTKIKAEAQARLQEKTADRIADAKERAKKEIERRIEHLEKLMERIAKMVRVSDDTESSLETTIEGQIAALTTLELQIMGTDATTSLRSYIESITKSYRIYALVMPQISIIAAADRVLGTASQLDQFAGKLELRINATSTTSASLTASLAEMKVKIASAKQKANEAVEAVKTLQPDNGDKAKQQANLAELKTAHEKVRSAQEDLKEARKIAGEIVRGLKALTKPDDDDGDDDSATTTDDSNN